MKLYKTVSLLIFSTLFCSCFTLNVNMNFPETAVQKATDDFVHELYREKGKSTEGGSESSPISRGAESLLHSFSDFKLIQWMGIPSVWADEPQPQSTPLRFQIDPSKVDKIREKLAEYLPEVLVYKRTGILGETSDGRIIIKNSEKLKPLLKKKLEKLVFDENQARTELYTIVIQSNQLTNSHLVDVKKSFSHSFQVESPTGTWLQNDFNQWIQKK